MEIKESAPKATTDLVNKKIVVRPNTYKKRKAKVEKVNTIEYTGDKEQLAISKDSSLKVDASAALAVGEPEFVSSATKEQMTDNWDMINDVLVKLHDDITFYENKLVVKGQNKINPEIVDTVEEKEKVKSYIKFGTVISTGSNRQVQVGDVISANVQGVKGIDYCPGYAMVANYALMAKLKTDGGSKDKPASKNILGRILQGFCKWVGCCNVHK